MDRLSFSSDLEKAVANADLVIESVPEDPSIKRFYKKASSSVPKTIFASNSSTMLLASLPNQQVDQLNLQLHFANEIWKHNTAEIGDIGTDRTYLTPLLRLPKSIGTLKKRTTNSLLVPLLSAGLDLLW
jgi:3-hydroxybutyryl-CoA dehydrogenase